MVTVKVTGLPPDPEYSLQDMHQVRTCALCGAPLVMWNMLGGLQHFKLFILLLVRLHGQTHGVAIMVLRGYGGEKHGWQRLDVL